MTQNLENTISRELPLFCFRLPTVRFMRYMAILAFTVLLSFTKNKPLSKIFSVKKKKKK